MSRGSGAARGRQAVTMRPICRSRRDTHHLLPTGPSPRAPAPPSWPANIADANDKSVKNTPLIGAILTAFFT